MRTMFFLTATLVLCGILLSSCSSEDRSTAMSDMDTRRLRIDYEKQREVLAQTAYQLGQLAESRLEYVSAVSYYKEASALDPSDPRYEIAENKLRVMVDGSTIP